MDTEHDWSEFSDHCTECALSRYDAEGIACAPSTDDSPEACAELMPEHRGRRIDMDGNRSVSLFRNVRPNEHGLIFQNGEYKTVLKVSTEALLALLVLIKEITDV